MNNFNFRHFLNNNKWLIIPVILILYSIFLRFYGIWYSDLQGDEINPLRYLDNIYGTTPGIDQFFTYLLDQKRGPGQYIINYINTSIFGFNSEFQVRFPYFVFSSLALVSIYFLARKIFNQKVAVFSVLLMGLNGLYIAFGRITQYQSFMYLVSPLSLFIFIKSFYQRSYLGIVFSGFLLSLCMLGHYDTLSFAPFFIGFLLTYLLQNKKQLLYVVKSGFAFFISFAIPSLLFYIPFLSSSYYESTAKGYLLGRLFGSGFMPRTPYHELGKLLTLYMPSEAWVIFFVLTCFGLFFLFSNFEYRNFFKINKRFIRWIPLISICIFIFAVFFSVFPIKPRSATFLEYGSAIILLLSLFFTKKVKPEIIGIISWFLISFSVYFFFIKDPRTHVYITFLPAFLLAGYALNFLFNLKNNIVRGVFWCSFLAYSIYLGVFYYVVFIDTNPEYPWFEKDIFGRVLYSVGRVRYKKVDGVFGFNSNRHWKDIRTLYDKGCLVGPYNSNEKNSITRFYLGFDQTYPDNPDFIFSGDTFFIVEAPQSWYYTNIDRYNKIVPYPVIHIIYNKDLPVVYVLGNLSIYKDRKMLCEL